MKETDEIVIGKVLEGDQHAFAVLVDRYKDRVYSLVLKVVRNKELAEELAQDVFVKAYTSLNKFRKEATFSTWIYRIAYNTAISETRKKKIQSVAFDVVQENRQQQKTENEVPAEAIEEKFGLLKQAMNTLKPDDHMLVTLFYLDEKSVEEISKIMGISLSNVKVKLFRIRKKLQDIVSKSRQGALAFY